MKQKIIAADRYDLIGHIQNETNINGDHCSLNHIDVSEINDMNNLFYCSSFNGDISEWNVSNVKNMSYMFESSKFNGDISKWDTKNVESMECMFSSAQFSGDISNWDVSKVKNMNFMFYYSNFKQDLTSWTPFELDKIDQIFDNCDSPIPYWYNFNSKKQRTMAINNYLLHGTLLEELDNKNPITKRLKI